MSCGAPSYLCCDDDAIFHCDGDNNFDSWLSLSSLGSEFSGRVHLVGVEGKPGSLLNLVDVYL